jgi:hypothetical protein
MQIQQGSHQYKGKLVYLALLAGEYALQLMGTLGVEAVAENKKILQIGILTHP